jgi:hypothetical protein
MQCFKTRRFSKDLKDPRHLLAVFVFCVFCVHFTDIYAQHLRIYACAIANDSAGASMGGSSNGSGLYQSDDTGKTWNHVGWDNIKCYSMDMVQSSNGRILYEATGLGILRSTDYGEHWKQITDWRISEAMDVSVTQRNPKKVTILTPLRSQSERGFDSTTIPYRKVWQTIDSGATWSKVKIRFHDMGEAQSWYDRLDYDNAPIFYDDEDDTAEHIIEIHNSQGHAITIKASLQDGIVVNGIPTLPHRQIWTLKSFLVTP